MESAAIFNFTVPNVCFVLERTAMFSVNSATWTAMRKSSFQGFGNRGKLVISCAMASQAAIVKSGASSDGQPQVSEKKTPKFPNGFETLVQDVCDKTEIAELKLKVGDFEMHVRRNVGTTTAPASVVSSIPPPVTSETRTESAPAAPSPPPKAAENISPFTNASFKKSSKLAALEASGSSAFVLVSSTSVGSFRKGRTFKGKKQPSICKEGAVIKEGQVIGYVDQFGTEEPVKSAVAGEVLKVLLDEGEAVGYGDPLVAVLPSFHGLD